MLYKTKNYKKIAFSLALTLLTSSFSGIVLASEESGFSVERLTIQPGETIASINLNWYAPNTTTDAQIKINGVVTGITTTSALHIPTELKTDKYTDGNKVACKATVEGLAPDTIYTYQISNDSGVTCSQEYTYKTPASDSFKFT